MNKKQIDKLCLRKQQELLNKYFGNTVYEAAILRPETIGEYSKELPRQIEAEYFEYLKEVWTEVSPNDSRSLEDILDKRHISMLITINDREEIKHAYNDAKRQTLWERLTKSNNKDVTYYKGLLKVYTEELLNCMRIDFIEDIDCNLE